MHLGAAVGPNGVDEAVLAHLRDRRSRPQRTASRRSAIARLEQPLAPGFGQTAGRTATRPTQ
jgi:hypothetical protein